MGSLRNPVGSLAPAVYWRRRVLVLLALLAVLALILYACSGSGSGKKHPTGSGKTSGPVASQSLTPTGGGSSSQAASGGASGASGSPGGPTSAGGVPSGSAGSGGGSASGTGGVNGGVVGANGGTNGGTNGGASGTGPTGTAGGPGCQLTLSLTSQAAAYANGVDPQFTVAVVNKGTSDCDVDVSPKSLVLNIYSGLDHIWSSADCATGGKDLRGIAPGAVQTVTYTWNRSRSSQGCAPNGGSAALGMYYGVVSLGSGSGPNAPSAQSQPKTFELKTGS